jgi:two-component system sensor histidine kinase UhpB
VTGTCRNLASMRPESSPQLYWKVCLINGVVFVAAAALLVLSPATVSPEVTSRELGVLAAGVVVILAANALLLRGTLAPLDQLIHQMDATDVNRSDRRLSDAGGGVAGRLARSFNDLEDRLEAERATRNVRALAAQEAERHRIAQELHDEVGQRLTVVLLGVTRALREVVGEGAEELKLVQENARSSLVEVRRLVRGLRPGVLEDLGLVPALEAMATEFAAQAGVDVRCRLDVTLRPLTPEAELVIFRVAQEALTNVARHAHASSVELSVSRSSELVSLRVCDDGRGIEHGATGDGIRGMRERALVVGGRLRIGPGTDGQGTDLRLDVPADGASG